MTSIGTLGELLHHIQGELITAGEDPADFELETIADLAFDWSDSAQCYTAKAEETIFPTDAWHPGAAHWARRTA